MSITLNGGLHYQNWRGSGTGAYLLTNMKLKTEFSRTVLNPVLNFILVSK